MRSGGLSADHLPAPKRRLRKHHPVPLSATDPAESRGSWPPAEDQTRHQQAKQRAWFPPQQPLRRRRLDQQRERVDPRAQLRFHDQQLRRRVDDGRNRSWWGQRTHHLQRRRHARHRLHLREVMQKGRLNNAFLVKFIWSLNLIKHLSNGQCLTQYPNSQRYDALPQ